MSNIAEHGRSNAWSTYEQHGRNAFREDGLRFILLQCENGHVVITQVLNLLLILYGRPWTA
ncbi:Ragulator complex protein LAMTOR2 like [Pseudolycoriella hygida]|uniref:Ragulator complex protein LAMTOR2 like n=1 Tax=Pseudolycoriella hygida TaxID=35572 RepID=A0A9Q0N9H6_9DIPT|nr:Ragulator complex protein LAMTOR2 like [Pseudolycoriella hygida]